MKLAAVAGLAVAATTVAATPTGKGHDHGHGHGHGSWWPHLPWWPKPKELGLDDLAKKAGLLYFGTAVDNPGLNNSKYLSIAWNKHEFGQITPANGQKFMYIEPQRGVFNYTMGDQIIKKAKKNGQMRRCHTLAWHSQLPDWLTSRNWTRAELTSVLDNHIKHEMTYYKGECYAWDVLNEAFNDDGTVRSTIWSDTLGPDFIATIFKLAGKYDPTAKLYYNDYNIERVGNKSNAVREVVKDLKSRKIRIDGVGLQAHFTIARAPLYDEQVANMKAFTALGVEIAITELDVRMYFPETPANDTAQATAYANTVKACKDVKGCVGVTVWDFYDPFTWILTAGDYFANQGASCLYYANFTKKPAWHAIAKVLSGK